MRGQALMELRGQNSDMTDMAAVTERGSVRT